MLFAHPSTLNNRKSIGCSEPNLCVCDGGTPYVAISKGFGFGISLWWEYSAEPFDMATYGVPPSQTPKVGSAQPMGLLLFKVDGWANSNEFHSGPLLQINHD